MADTLPTCQCVAGQAIPDQWTSIYAAVLALAGSPGSLPTVQCTAGQTQQTKLANIYCAVLAWTNQ